MAKPKKTLQKLSKVASHPMGSIGMRKLLEKLDATEVREQNGHACSPEEGGTPSPCFRCNYGTRTFEGDPRGGYIIVTHQESGIRFELRMHELIVIRAFLREATDFESWKEAWDFSSNNWAISHDCHNPWCTNEKHIRLTTTLDNVGRRITCFHHSWCVRCGVRHYVCQCTPRCRLTRPTTCSACERLDQAPDVPVVNNDCAATPKQLFQKKHQLTL